MAFFLVNLVGALGPETAFDATWYHLTIPKIFLENGSIYYIKGNLFYYSLMPKLTEMLYLSSLILSGEILAKLIHFSFGLLILVVTYKIARLYLNRTYSLLAGLAFYSNLVVAWLSITAYIDLARTFYESLSFFYFLYFTKNKKIINILFCSIFLGFAISTKYLSLISILIFAILILFIEKKSIYQKIMYLSILLIIPIIMVSPWLIYAFLNTGNPLYPMFTFINSQDKNIFFLSMTNIINTYSKFFLKAQDPVSPIYLILVPFIFIKIKYLFKSNKYLIMFFLISFLFLLITPKDGGSRFIVHLLPAYSVLVAIVISQQSNKWIKKILLYTIFIIFLVNISYRSIANKRYLGVILGMSTKEKYLMENLNFSFGDFYDEEGKIKKIVGDEVVLLIGMHNLFYVDFNYTLQDWDNRNVKIKFILVQGGELADHYRNSKLVYENNRTHVKLYKIN